MIFFASQRFLFEVSARIVFEGFFCSSLNQKIAQSQIHRLLWCSSGSRMEVLQRCYGWSVHSEMLFMDGFHFANRHNQSDGPMTGQTRVRSTHKSRYLIFRQSVCCLFPICWSRNCPWIVFLSRTVFFNLLRNARSRRGRVENSVIFSM